MQPQYEQFQLNTEEQGQSVHKKVIGNSCVCVNYAAFRKSFLIIPLRPRCNVESSLQNANLVDTATRDLENQLTRMGFITIQHFYIAQGRRETRHICDIANKVGLFTRDTEHCNAE